MAQRVALKDPPKGGYFGGGRPGPGRPKGSSNKSSRVLRDAIILAAEASGENKKGRGELVGYLKRLADHYPDLFTGLLGRVLPMQVVGPNEGPVKVEFTVHQLEERLKERGLPVLGHYDPPLVIEHKPKVTNGATNGHAR